MLTEGSQLSVVFVASVGETKGIGPLVPIMAAIVAPEWLAHALRRAA